MYAFVERDTNFTNFGMILVLNMALTTDTVLTVVLVKVNVNHQDPTVTYAVVQGFIQSL